MNNTTNKVFWSNFNDYICYYRLNMHRFATEYLGIKLKLFQKILLYAMSNPKKNVVTTFIWFASRGAGKSFLAMLFAVCVAILYPGSIIVVAAQNIGAAKKLIAKLKLLISMSDTLEAEILSYKDPKDGAKVIMRGGSEIITSVNGDGARGARANIIILDERRQISSDIIETVFIPFLTSKRWIPAYNIPMYAKYASMEHNSKIYLTSVGYKDEDSYKEFQRFAKFAASGDDSYNVFAIPYQIAVECDIIDKSLIEAQARENITDLSNFSMEMEVIPFGDSEGSIINHIEINRSQNVITPLIEPTIKEYIETNGDLRKLKTYVAKEQEEIRVLSVDIATAMGRSNDASSWTIIRNFNHGDYYDKIIAYNKAINGMNIDDQVLLTKRLWHFFDIDYLVIDAGGAIGIAFANLLGNITYDPQLNKKYPGFKTVNSSEKFDIRVTDQNAVPIMYCVQVSGAGASQMQADMAFIAKTNFERNRIFMLIDSASAIDELNMRYDYYALKSSLDPFEKERAENLIANFENSEELIKEMLTTKIKRLTSGRITFDEGGGRKDRFISLLYGLHFIHKLEEDLYSVKRTVNLSEYGYMGGASSNTRTTNSRIPFQKSMNFKGWGRR